jgi:carbonic anhydrase
MRSGEKSTLESNAAPLLDPANLQKWNRMFTDVDAMCVRQVELLRASPFIPDNVTIHGYIYEVETGILRHPWQ